MSPTESVEIEIGERAVHLARSTLEAVLGPDPPKDPAAPFRWLRLPAAFDEPRGVFTTLKQFSSGLLRGCVGFPLPVVPLRVAIPQTAAGAALEDPRFPPVTLAELPRLTVEVSVLTVPETIPAPRPRDRPAAVRVGIDGLIVKWRRAEGLLLPQVAVEQHWTAEEFLSETCVKAGLPSDAWLRPETEIRRFGASGFAESEPGGAIRAMSFVT
ncbi:MAG: TIGR00296 family protein [Thermoplasmata archaeon]|nr:TIGR00296 family protein [Thermoplasmata archaeon]